MTIIKGNLKNEYLNELNFITQKSKDRYSHIKTSNHEWINLLDDKDLKNTI
jgi:hypothetical protein